MKFTFHMGVTLRCYGNVEIEADSIEAALPLLTADYIGENIDIKETTTDMGQDLAVIDVSDAETGEELADYGGHSLPSPYDPTPDRDLLAEVKEFRRTVAYYISKEKNDPEGVRMKTVKLNLLDDLIAKAEGCTNG